MSRFVYLHGFASGPGSSKARFLQERWQKRGIDLLVPDLVPGPFEEITLTGQLAVIEQALAGEPAVLIGSSMGGYLAALYASHHPETEKVVLMAPAFRFAERWAERVGPQQLQAWRETGYLDVFHYGQNRPARVGYGLYLDAQGYPPFPCIPAPCLIIHGTKDDVVPFRYSEEFVESCPGAKLLARNDDHELRGDLEDVARAIEAFLGLW